MAQGAYIMRWDMIYGTHFYLHVTFSGQEKLTLAHNFGLSWRARCFWLAAKGLMIHISPLICARAWNEKNPRTGAIMQNY